MASYKLTVGSISGIQLNVDNVTTKFSDKEFYVTMENLTYTKKIFAPSEIHTVLSVKAKDTSTTSFPKLSELQSTFSKKLVTLKDGDTTVCENFFVYRMKPSHGKASSASAAMKVELEIYSLDKLLTIDKYCNAFTAKKLGAEIFMGELLKFRLGTQTVEGTVNLQILNYTFKDKKQLTEVRQPYLVQYNESFYDFLARSASRCGEMLYFEGGKLHLGMSANLATATADQTTVAESVDYEDCFENVLTVSDRHYDFMKRGEHNDNRYVDSAFQLLGAFDDSKDPNPNEEEKQKTNSKKEVTSVTKTKTTYFKEGTETEEVQTTFYTKSDKEPEKQLAGEPKKEVSTLTLKKTDGTELLKVSKTVTYTYEKGTDGKYTKKDKKFVYSTKTEQTVTGESFPGIYHQPEPDDALFEELEKDGYTSVANEWTDYRQFLFSFFFLSRLNDTSLYDIISNWVIDVAAETRDAIVTSSIKNKENNESNLTLNANDHPDQVKDDKYSLFSTLTDVIDSSSSLTVNKKDDEVSLLASTFFSKIRSASREVSETHIRLNYGATDKGLCLGDVLKVGNGEDDFYIVTKVELNDQGNYVVEVTPSYYKSTNKSDGSSSYTVTEFIPCPPLLPDVPAVRISEPQVAFVEQNLDPNKLGRVRVKYPWQTTESDSSPWVRMATPFATNGGGVNFKPESGDEVLLNYEDGNIERPYIVGSLQSKYVTDHWGSLSDRVIQSKNGHTIQFKDDDGIDFFTGLLPAADLVKSFVPASGSILGLQEFDDLAGGIEIKDRYGLYKIDLSSSGRSVTIESPMGNVDINAFTGISISAPNGNIEIKGKNVSIAASNKLTVESGSAVSERFISKPSWGILKDVADKTIGKWLDFPLLRTVLEVFIRPVDGTLKIKSNTYVLVEAGKGSAQVPRDDYNKPDIGTGLDQMFDTSEPDALGKLKAYIPKINSKADSLCNAINSAFENAKKEKEAYEKVALYDKLTKRKVDGTDDICKYISGKIDTAPFKIDEIVTEDDFGFDAIDEFKYQVLVKDNNQYKAPEYKDPEKSQEEKDDKENGEKKYKERCDKEKTEWTRKLKKDNDEIKPKREAIVAQARKLGTVLKTLFDATKAWSEFDLDPVDKSPVYFPDSLKNVIKSFDIFTQFIANANKGEVDWTAAFDTEFKKEKLIIHRKVAYALLNATKDNCKDLYSFGKAKEPSDYGDDTKWVTFVQSIAEPDDPLTLQKAGAAALGYFNDLVGKKSPWADTFVSRHRWKAPEKGRILLSDQPGRTLHFDSDELAANDNAGEMTRAHIIELRRFVNGVK